MKKIYFLLMIFTLTASKAQLREFNFYLDADRAAGILHLVSVETVPCAGYTIKYVQLWNHDTLIIDIRGFVRPEPCYSGTDVATAKITLAEVKTRTFALKFRWKRMEDLWKISRVGESFTATPIRSTFTSYSK